MPSGGGGEPLTGDAFQHSKTLARHVFLRSCASLMLVPNILSTLDCLGLMLVAFR
jgi:hypothetical protein